MIYAIDKKNMKILIIVTLIVLSSFGVGYGMLSRNMKIEGSVSVIGKTTDVSIKSVSSSSLVNGASETANSTYSKLNAGISVSFPNTNSKASYTINIKNNGTTSVRYASIDFTSSNDAMTYALSGINTATVLDPGEEINVTIDLKYTDAYKYSLPSTTTGNLTFNFNFVVADKAKFKPLTGSITPYSGSISDTDKGAPFTLNITNPNEYPVSYTLSGSNNFGVYNSDGNSTTYYLNGGASDSYTIYVNDTSSTVSMGTTASVDIEADAEEYYEKVPSKLGTVSVNLPNKAKYVILSSGVKDTPSNVDYTKVDSTATGIYSLADNNGTTYYFRGANSNNYFSFGGLSWRIVRIDGDANIRLILNGYLTNNGNVVTKAFKSTNSASSLEDANKLVRLVNDATSDTANSPIYGSLNSTDGTTLRGWYNNNLKSYESYIVDSKFCMDTSGGYDNSSQTGKSVFYYAAYKKVGPDSRLYSPDFSCSSEDVLTDKIGMLSADEYVLAGGVFKTANASMYLNDFGETNIWWTISPSYFDSNQSKVGVLAVGQNGILKDWFDANTIATAHAIRPVITVDGSKIITGTGTSQDPYKFA